jgi:hypothetical protein
LKTEFETNNNDPVFSDRRRHSTGGRRKSKRRKTTKRKTTKRKTTKRKNRRHKTRKHANT